jgi:uncharacterized RDD family membrane protein YckC
VAQEPQNPSPAAPGGTPASPGSPQSPGQPAPQSPASPQAAQSPGPQAPASPQAPHSHGSPSGPLGSGELRGPLPRASFGQRLGAFAIDIAIVIVGELAVFLVFGGLASAIASSGSTVGAVIGSLIGLIGVLLYIVLPLAYFGYMEGQPSGQTVGKRAINIRVVDFETAGSLTLGRGVLRNLARILSGFLFGLGYFWMLWDPQQQCWHDKLVSTHVVPTSAYPV